MAKSGKEPAASGKASAKNASVSAKNASVSKKGTGKVKSVSGKQSGKSPAVPRGNAAGLVPVICSECHDDFMFDPAVKSEGITCPVCEHGAGRPDEATLHHIAEKRAQQRTNFMIAFGTLLVSGLAFLLWVALTKNPGNVADDATFYGPLGAWGLFGLIGLIFAVKFESNRWEVYF